MKATSKGGCDYQRQGDATMSLTEAIKHMKAANERNNASMLDYLDHRAFERREWFKGLLFLSTELAEQAYQKARLMMFESWKAEGKK